MTITNVFLFVPFVLAQIFAGIFIIKWSVDIGMFFPVGMAGMIFLINAVCGIISSLQD